MKNTRSGEMLLIHCTQVSKSGAAKYVNELFRAVRQLNRDARLVCPLDFEHRHMHPAEKLSLFCAMDGKNTSGKLRSMALQFIEATGCIQRLARSASARTTVAHFNFPGLPFFALYQFKKLKRSGVRLALTVHDVLPHRWLLPMRLNGVERWFLKNMYQCADALFVHHESQAEKLVLEFGIPKALITVVHHGVFSLSDKPLPYFDGKEFVALCFGAIRENKGVAEAIEAVQQLRADGFPLRLIIAGAASQGESAYWGACKEKIGVRPDGIDVVEGYIPESDIHKYFERSSFVLLPYSDFFSQSGVATMALSSGRAIVSTDAGGLSEMLVTGQYGVRIDNASAHSVRLALQKAMGLGHLNLKEMGMAAFDFFRENYSWETAAKIQIDICRNVAAQ